MLLISRKRIPQKAMANSRIKFVALYGHENWVLFELCEIKSMPSIQNTKPLDQPLHIQKTYLCNLSLSKTVW